MWNDQLMPVDDRLQQTQRLYERAVFGGDASAVADVERHLSAVEADLALARGRVAHARFLAAASGTLPGPDDVGDELVLFERASELYVGLGDVRGEAEAQFWIGTFHQVVRHDDVVAVPALERARALATEVDDFLTLSYALRHLGIAGHRAGELDEARSYLEESTQLRRQLGLRPVSPPTSWVWRTSLPATGAATRCRRYSTRPTRWPGRAPPPVSPIRSTKHGSSSSADLLGSSPFSLRDGRVELMQAYADPTKALTLGSQPQVASTTGRCRRSGVVHRTRCQARRHHRGADLHPLVR